jgi:hypothetical protein
MIKSDALGTWIYWYSNLRLTGCSIFENRNFGNLKATVWPAIFSLRNTHILALPIGEELKNKLYWGIDQCLLKVEHLRHTAFSSHNTDQCYLQ